MNPILIPVGTYQWDGAVESIRNLIRTGNETPVLIEGIRTRWGLTTVEVEAARLDAHLQEQP